MLGGLASWSCTPELRTKMAALVEPRAAKYSAQAVGVVWFTTTANHHHNRRNDYRTIGASLATDF